MNGDAAHDFYAELQNEAGEKGNPSPGDAQHPPLPDVDLQVPIDDLLTIASAPAAATHQDALAALQLLEARIATQLAHAARLGTPDTGNQTSVVSRSLRGPIALGMAAAIAAFAGFLIVATTAQWPPLPAEWSAEISRAAEDAARRASADVRGNLTAQLGQFESRLPRRIEEATTAALAKLEHSRAQLRTGSNESAAESAILTRMRDAVNDLERDLRRPFIFSDQQFSEAAFCRHVKALEAAQRMQGELALGNGITQVAINADCDGRSITYVRTIQEGPADTGAAPAKPARAVLGVIK